MRYSKTTKFLHLVHNEIRWRQDSTVLAAVRTSGASAVCKDHSWHNKQENLNRDWKLMTKYQGGNLISLASCIVFAGQNSYPRVSPLPAPLRGAGTGETLGTRFTPVRWADLETFFIVPLHAEEPTMAVEILCALYTGKNSGVLNMT